MVVSPPRDIAFRRLRLGKIAGLVALDHVLIFAENLHEAVGHFLGRGAIRADDFRARKFRGFAKAGGCAERIEFVDETPDGGTRGQAGSGVALTAFGGNEKILDGTGFPLLLGGPLDEVARIARRIRDRCDVAIAFDCETGDRLAGFRDAVDHATGRAWLNADHHTGGYIGIAAGADQRAEMKFEVFGELEAAVSVRQGERTLNVVGHRFAGAFSTTMTPTVSALSCTMM